MYQQVYDDHKAHQMKHKHLIRNLPIVLAIMIIGYLLFNEETSDRSQYEAFILEKARHLNESEKGAISDLKSSDKPDEAAFQEYITTVDPALGFVPKQRLWAAYEYTKRKTEEQLSSRDYEPIIEWEQTGANMGGRTRMIMFDPNDPNNEKVWAGGVTGGLWYNSDITDVGEEWIPVGDFWSNLAISCMAYDPNDTEIFYIGTGEAQTARIIYRESSGVGAGIFKSTDAGETWELMESTKDFKYINDIAIRDENGVSVIYTAVVSGTYMGIDHESGPSEGLFRSDDGGESWEQVLPEINEFMEVPYSPADIEIAANGRIFVGTMENLSGSGGATVLYSDEGTEGSWSIYDYYNSKISNENYFKVPARTIVASAPSKPDRVYAQFAAGYDSGPFRYYRGRYMAASEDGGDNWEQITRPDDYWSTLAWHAFILKVDPGDENTVFTGGLDLWRSSTGGNSWNRVSDWSLMYWGGGDEYVHADQHNIRYKPDASNTAIFSCDGGVFLTNTANNSYPVFIERNQGYNTLQFYTCAISPAFGSKKYIGGLQDNGTLYYNDSPLDINDMIDGGDGAYCFWDQNESSIMITSVYYNQYTFWHNNNAVEDMNGESGTFISPADYDYEENILYSNGVTFDGSYKNNLFKVNGVPFDLEGQLINIGTDSDVAFSHVKYSRYSPDGSSTLFVGTQSGKLFKVVNAQGLPSADEIGSPDFPTANISSIALGDSEDVLLVTFSNYGVSSVWYTKDGGTSWEEKEANLPDMPVRWALFHPDNNNQVMLATETGIWATRTLDVGVTEWAPANEGLANVRVDMLQLRQADDMVLAATHGRGLATAKFELDIYYVGEDEAEIEPNFISIYPNPAQHYFTINTNSEIGQPLTITITDLNGKVIREFYDVSQNEQYKRIVNLSDFTTGIYFVNVQTGKTTAVNKLIVQ